ncbi:MAG: cobaltochelatase subunit CobN [Acidobacteriota bacterium]
MRTLSKVSALGQSPPTRGWLLSGLVALYLLATPQIAQGATLLGIVSERNAAEMAAAGAQFDSEYPGQTLLFRTPQQVAELTDGELGNLWDQADQVLMAGVFGDVVPRLEGLAQARPKPLLAVSSDRRLVRLSRFEGRAIFDGASPQELDTVLAGPEADEELAAFVDRQSQRFPDQAGWIRGAAYWRGRGTSNYSNLIAYLLAEHASRIRPGSPAGAASIRYYQGGRVVPRDALSFGDRPVVLVLDLDTGDRLGDRDLLDALEQQAGKRDLATVAILSRWGEATTRAVAEIASLLDGAPLAAIVSLQDFVLGGGTGRAEVTRVLEQLDVPVVNGIRMIDRTRAQWQLSNDGIAWDAVHYRVAMPELQGIGQSLVLAVAEPPRVDELTGLRVSLTQPEPEMVALLADRLARWQALRVQDNAEKRVAIVYYNHPPGRHNIGADNLDVPASLWQILTRMRDAGYDTGDLPESPEELLDQLQERGVYLPENAAAIAQLSEVSAGLPAAGYRSWFETLPDVSQRELVDGPLGFLHASLERAVALGEIRTAQTLVEHTGEEIHHILEGADHPARDRALDLLSQLLALYRECIGGEARWSEADTFVEGLRATGIEGLRGWGEPPGQVMVHGGRLLFPGVTFGNVFVGPQPPRGWELDEELLHANTTFPPTHHYLAFYHWLRDGFGADAVIHLGRHSTYEFLPRRRVGLTMDDYPLQIAGDLPGIYPYIVDGIGEGIQAKRRGLAVIVDHLTPPLQTTPLYEDLLELRQLVESYEAAEANQDSPILAKSIARIREKVDALEIRQELEEELAAEHHLDEVALDQVDDHLLVHEVGHYLTELQERFMPMGLHIFGKPWEDSAVAMMLQSMSGDAAVPASVQQALTDSPELEMAALLRGLDGGFVAPGKGNDPIRTPEALPTGRNFYAIDGSLVPSRIAHELGVELATEARKSSEVDDGSLGVILWASDTVRDEGVMVAFAMELLGVRPVWNARGILKSLERLPLAAGDERLDVVVTTSGLFRDLYANLLIQLDRAILLALDGASLTIERNHPELAPALAAALTPLGDLRAPGAEPIDTNRVAQHWIRKVRESLAEAPDDAARAGRRAALRIFGDAPGAYGAGINRLVERSGAWEQRAEVAEAYLSRMGHAYGIGIEGQPAHASFQGSLAGVRRTYHGRASNLYGLLDNNDAFDYLGGLSMAVEHVSGQAPKNHVIHHADPENPNMLGLRQALMQELRGEHLNPEFIQALMQHGYAGARTLGSEFIEYLWGWQVTNPEIIDDWAWEEVKSVYIDDKYDIGVDEFLEDGHNVHVKTNILAVFLVAIQKGFWQADAETVQQLASEFAELVSEHGLPGSGHTRPDHPMLEWLEDKITPDQAQRLDEIRQAALGERRDAARDPSTITEIYRLLPDASPWLLALVLGVLLAVFVLGIRRGSR